MCIDIVEIGFGIPRHSTTGKWRCIFTKLAMRIDIVEIYFEIANVQISSIFDSYLSAIR